MASPTGDGWIHDFFCSKRPFKGGHILFSGRTKYRHVYAFCYISTSQDSVGGHGFSWFFRRQDMLCSCTPLELLNISSPSSGAERTPLGPKISRHTRIAMDGLVAMSMNIDHLHWLTMRFWVMPYFLNKSTSLQHGLVFGNSASGNPSSWTWRCLFLSFLVQSAFPLNHASGMIF